MSSERNEATSITQAQSLRPRLNEALKDADVEDVLWAISPLRRALETFLDACPWRTTLDENALNVEIKW